MVLISATPSIFTSLVDWGVGFTGLRRPITWAMDKGDPVGAS